MYWIWLKNGYKNRYDHVSRDYGTALNLIGYFLRSYFHTHFITNQDAFLYSKFWRVGMHDGAYRFFWWWGIISIDMSNQRNWAMMLVFKIFLCFDVPSNDTIDFEIICTNTKRKYSHIDFVRSLAIWNVNLCKHSFSKIVTTYTAMATLLNDVAKYI